MEQSFQIQGLFPISGVRENPANYMSSPGTIVAKSVMIVAASF